MPKDTLSEFLEREKLPDSYREQAQKNFIPFIETLRPLLGAEGRVPVLGIYGSQGSGKSTLAEFIHWYLQEREGLNIALLSLDDFYLRAVQRKELASTTHPLLRTRGVPGTHDIPLALNTIAKLRSLNSNEAMRLPRFDKARDDRAPEAAWPKVNGPIDLIVFEGWCVGASPQSPVELTSPVNDLECLEDSDGGWRSYVNNCLAGEYQVLFGEIDYLLMLRAPSFACVAGWRSEQERKLAQRQTNAAAAKGVMSQQEILRFIQHYERLTTHCLKTLAAKADCVMALGEQREILNVTYRENR